MVSEIKIDSKPVVKEAEPKPEAKPFKFDLKAMQDRTPTERGGGAPTGPSGGVGQAKQAGKGQGM